MMSYFRSRVSLLLKRILPKNQRNTGENDWLPVVKLADILKGQPTVTLRSLAFRDGNVSPLEILVIAALVADRCPRCVYEIGTFNGNTALQMAENAAVDAKIFTLDLPLATASTKKSVDAEDAKYIASDARTARRYVGCAVAGKIHEVFGDSASVDFRATLGGDKIDFAFIDGSHSYDYVKNDTEKIFEHLAPDGIVLWHDYDPYWHGVCVYINELQKTRFLRRIENTTLVYYRDSDGRNASSGYKGGKL